MQVDTKEAREFANSGYSYTGEEVRVWVHNMADEIERLRTVAENTVALLEHLTNNHLSASKHALCWRVLDQAREALKA